MLKVNCLSFKRSISLKTIINNHDNQIHHNLHHLHHNCRYVTLFVICNSFCYNKVKKKQRQALQVLILVVYFLASQVIVLTGGTGFVKIQAKISGYNKVALFAAKIFDGESKASNRQSANESISQSTNQSMNQLINPTTPS